MKPRSHSRRRYAPHDRQLRWRQTLPSRQSKQLSVISVQTAEGFPNCERVLVVIGDNRFEMECQFVDQGATATLPAVVICQYSSRRAVQPQSRLLSIRYVIEAPPSRGERLSDYVGRVGRI